MKGKRRWENDRNDPCRARAEEERGCQVQHYFNISFTDFLSLAPFSCFRHDRLPLACFRLFMKCLKLFVIAEDLPTRTVFRRRWMGNTITVISSVLCPLTNNRTPLDSSITMAELNMDEICFLMADSTSPRPLPRVAHGRD